MSVTINSKLVYVVGGDSSTALKVVNKIMQLAMQLDIPEYLHGDEYQKKERPIAPNLATADATRKYDNERAEYKRENEALIKLQEAAEGYLSVEAYEQLCIRLGQSATACLSAKEIFDGIKEHYAQLTSAQAEDMMNKLQLPWEVNKSLSKHIRAFASIVGEMKAGGNDITEPAAKETFWRSLIKLTRDVIYMSFMDKMAIPARDSNVSMAQLAAIFLTELKKEQYQELNNESAKATGAADAVLSVKEQQEKEAHFEAIRKANKEKYKDTPVESTCPVHTGAKEPHLWKDCTHRTGKKIGRSRRDSSK